MAEIFVNIAGYLNYQVSNFGNVKNVASGRILKAGRNPQGYLVVSLMSDGDKTSKTVQRLVATAFLENIDDKRIVDHIDRDKLNNHISNLRFATDSENQQNRTINYNNTSGFIGVRWNKQREKWQATITVNKISDNLGFFINKEDAIRVRQEAEILHFQEFRAA